MNWKTRDAMAFAAHVIKAHGLAGASEESCEKCRELWIIGEWNARL